MLSISECTLNSTQLKSYASKIGPSSDSSDLTCGLDGYTFSMNLTCPPGEFWSDTGVKERTYSCSCDGGSWPVDNAKCGMFTLLPFLSIFI